jgi:FixJ family two-component response regulator
MSSRPSDSLQMSASAGESAQPMQAADARSRVFVVDDDPTICRALERLLRSAGHIVETFHSAEAFLERSPRPANGSLILDVRMPGMSGIELQRHLLAEGFRPRIFFLSSVDDPRTRSAALSDGALAWFSKPLDAEALLAALDEDQAAGL